jgi:dipeptidyl aminopeptidase/acylaminoacyl peptidase
MQDDLVDAVNWAVARGIANPKKVAIFGSSYGGYATLEAMATNPGFFGCGVDISGQSDLLGWLTSLPPGYAPYKSTIFKRIGNPETDADFLKSRSPLFKADRIRDPLLITQGGQDPQVPKADAEWIVAKLKANGVPVEYLYFPDEGHGITRPQNRLIFWNTAEKFLAKYLGGRYEEVSGH